MDNEIEIAGMAGPASPISADPQVNSVAVKSQCLRVMRIDMSKSNNRERPKDRLDHMKEHTNFRRMSHSKEAGDRSPKARTTDFAEK
uniref:Uncharacterized protein n=1 Tax=Cucumis melo TaxID=3656 RepID=A0A9I9DEY6_CUCME